MAIINSHSYFVHVAFVSFLVFQTVDQMIFGRLIFLEQGGICGDSTGPPNGTRSEKVWEPLN